jgi:monovalent cation:H+ antiporter, CPA1 family
MTLATTVVLLFAIAMGVAMLTRPLRLPYTVALVVVGLALGATRILPAPHLTKDLLYVALLPGLLFEAAFHLDARDFWDSKVTILSLAVPGVVMAIAVTTAVLFTASRAVGFSSALSWPAALIFSALITATDPIAVTALFKTLGAPKRLGVIVEAESLVNDGTSVVLYTIAIGVATGAEAGVGNAVVEFVRVVGVGLLIGGALGFCISKLIARIDDPLIEITLTTIAAYGSFIAAEQMHASGVLATVTAGILCGSYGAPRGMSPSTRIAVESFWSYVAFALNSIVFLLIGFQVQIGRLLESWQAIIFTYIVVMLARAAIVFLVSSMVRRTAEAAPWSWSVVLTWGGLRGALSMVLALALAEDFPERALVIRLTFGVVILSILLNGVTVGPLLRWLGLDAASSPRPTAAVARP